jgi:hypothetical protein
MIGRRELDLYAYNTTELVPKGGHELRASVRYDCLWSMAESIYPLNIKLGHTSRVDCLVTRDRYGVLSKSIDKYKDRIVAMFIFREFLEVYIYMLPRVYRY